MRKKAEKLASRITELDLLRGIAVLLMIFDHVMFDTWGLFPTAFRGFPPEEGTWREIYSFSRFYWNWDVRINVRIVVVFVFLALTGICCSFSKSNLKRGLRLGGVALLMTGATYAVGTAIGDIDITILFGVLHCIALSLIVIGLLERLRTNKWIYLALGVVMIVSGYMLERGQPYISLERMDALTLAFRTMIGTAMSGGDSFSFFLYGGQIFVGVFIGRVLYEDRRSLFFKSYKNNPVTFIGRHSLIVYVLHQVLIPVVVGGVLLASGFTLSL